MPHSLFPRRLSLRRHGFGLRTALVTAAVCAAATTPVANAQTVSVERGHGPVSQEQQAIDGAEATETHGVTRATLDVSVKCAVRSNAHSGVISPNTLTYFPVNVVYPKEVTVGAEYKYYVEPGLLSFPTDFRDENSGKTFHLDSLSQLSFRMLLPEEDVVSATWGSDSTVVPANVGVDMGQASNDYYPGDLVFGGETNTVEWPADDPTAWSEGGWVATPKQLGGLGMKESVPVLGSLSPRVVFTFQAPSSPAFVEGPALSTVKATEFSADAPMAFFARGTVASPGGKPQAANMFFRCVPENPVAFPAVVAVGVNGERPRVRTYGVDDSSTRNPEDRDADKSSSDTPWWVILISVLASLVGVGALAGVVNQLR